MSVLSSAQLEQVLSRLPALPQVVTRSIAAIDRDEVTQIQVADILMQDPALVAQLLRLANSPFYGLSGKVSSVQDACVILGLHTIRSTLIAAGAMRAFPANKSQVYNREALWHHALCVAGTAQFLAARLRLEVGSAFTAGLLHDIGKLALDDCCAAALAEVIQYQKANDSYAFEAEQVVLGIDHMTLGAKLAQHWKLPAIVIAAIAGHHGKNPEPGRAKLVDLVNLSDLLCHGLRIGTQEDVLIPPLAAGCLERLGIKWNRIRDWLPEMDALIQQCNTLPIGN